MKRNLYESIKIKQSASGAAVDRDGCLSAVFAADVSAISGSPTSSGVSIAVTHCDTESGTYTAVDDERLFVGCKAEQAVAVGKQTIWNIDLLACKRYIKVPLPLNLLAAQPRLLRLHIRWCWVIIAGNDRACKQCADYTRTGNAFNRYTV